MNREGKRHVDIRRASREACEALTAYADAVEHGQRGEGLHEVHGALSRALGDYAAAAFNAGVSVMEDVEELVEDLATDWDDVEDVSEELPSGARIGILQRFEYVVPDATAVINAGREAYHELFPDDRPDEVDARVSSVPLAVSELLHRQGECVDDYLSDYGLTTVGTATRIFTIEPSLIGKLLAPVKALAKRNK